MFPRLVPPRSRTHRGVVAVLVCVTLPLLLGFAALTIDVGYVYNVRADTQNVADAAALAGATALWERDWTSVEDRALGIIEHNQSLHRQLSQNHQIVEIGRWDADSGTFFALDAADARRANAVRVVAARDGVPLFFSALFGKHAFDVTRESIAAIGQSSCSFWAQTKAKIKNGSRTDSYDSSEGPYDENFAGSEGHVCTCGQIQITGNSEINGDALYGGQGKFKGNISRVTGTVALITECFDPLLPPGGVPIDNDLIGLTENGEDPFDELVDQVQELVSDFASDNNDNDTIAPDGFKGFNPAKLELHIHNDTLTLPPGTFYFKTLKLHEGARLVLTGPTTIYIEKELDVHGLGKGGKGGKAGKTGSGEPGGIVNPSQDPADLTIIHAGGKVHLQEGVDFFGYVLAPNAKIKVEKGGDFFGAIVGKEVEFKQGSNFHADESLPLGEIAGPPILVR